MKETVVLKFYADWCGTCRMLKPIMEEVKKELPDILFQDVNTDEQPDFAGECGVQSLPTTIVVEGGVELRRHTGFMAKPALTNFILGV